MLVKNTFVISGAANTTCGVGVRHLQAVMLFLAGALCYSMKINLSVAVVAMTDPALPDSFDWDLRTQGLLLSSFFWGYVVPMVPAGEVAARGGGSWLLLSNLAVNSLVTLLTPLAAYRGGWQAVCACRVMQGAMQASLFHSFHQLIGQWFPLEERSTMGSFIYSGVQLGTACQMLVSGFIASTWGWPAVFYTSGALGTLWTAVYAGVGAGGPETARLVGERERTYIQASLGHLTPQKKAKTPWRALVTSPAFLSLVVMHGGYCWGFWTLATEIPTYMDKVLGINIKQNGVLSALPYFTLVAISFPVGMSSDFILKRQWMSLTTCRKLYNTVGHVGSAAALAALALLQTPDITVVVALLVLAIGCTAGSNCGFLLVHLDMAPNCAGTLMGITNCVGSIVALLVPLATTAMLKDERDAGAWRLVFLVCAGVYLVVSLVFLVFATSERQPWGDNHQHTDESHKTAQPVHSL